MRELFQRFFGHRTPSKEEAKQRLKLLLIHDQVDLSAAQLEAMKAEILEVIARYVEIDPASVDFRLQRDENSVSLVSSVPVRRVTERVGETTDRIERAAPAPVS